MTLIVAKILDDKIYIESDSKITGEAVVRNNPIDSQLKALLLDSRLCLCYAGNISYAIEAYSYFIDNGITKKNWNNYISYLLKLNIQSDNQTDFILAGYDNNLPILLEIKDGAVNSVQNSWIGSLKSFSKFQEFYQDEINEKTEPKNAIANAFHKVLENEISNSVGGFRFSVITDNKNYKDTVTGEVVKILKYELKSESYLGRDEKIEFTEKGESKPIPSGDATTGSYTISHFTPVADQENCIGVHFGYGDFGLFYPPKDLLNGIVYSKVTASEFINKVLKDYNITLSGMEIIPKRMGMKYIIAGK
jgi:hypothetical protein